MKTSRGTGWRKTNWAFGSVLGLLSLIPPAGAAEEVSPPGSGGPMGPEGNLYAELRTPGERFGLDGTGQPVVLRLEADPPELFAPVPGEDDAPPTPLLAGFLSLLVPGTGQLLQGDQRGWVYLGVEAASWFSYFGLHGAGQQAEEDYKQFADAGWDWTRYVNTSSCFDGLGPVNLEEESAALWDHRLNSPDQYYQDIADRDVYACGWQTADQRLEYRSMIGDADGFYSAAQWVVGVLVLNRVVSAIDAAKSASGKRKAWLQSLQVAPTPDGFRVELARSF